MLSATMGIVCLFLVRVVVSIPSTLSPGHIHNFIQPSLTKLPSLTDITTATLSLLLKRKANVTPIPVIPPTHIHWDNYLVPSLQAAYDFSSNRTRIKAVLLSNPNNPLSRCYPRETLRELLEFCQERSLHLIVDEGSGLTGLDSKEGGGDDGGRGKIKGGRNGAAFVSALSLTEPLVPEGAVKVDPSRVHVVWSVSRLFGLGGLKIVSRSSCPWKPHM